MYGRLCLGCGIWGASVACTLKPKLMLWALRLRVEFEVLGLAIKATDFKRWGACLSFLAIYNTNVDFILQIIPLFLPQVHNDLESSPLILNPTQPPPNIEGITDECVFPFLFRPVSRVSTKPRRTATQRLLNPRALEPSALKRKHVVVSIFFSIIPI